MWRRLLHATKSTFGKDEPGGGEEDWGRLQGLVLSAEEVCVYKPHPLPHCIDFTAIEATETASEGGGSNTNDDGGIHGVEFDSSAVFGVSVPVEVLQLIFIMLDSRSLARTGAVSKNWHVMTSMEVLWRGKCYEEFRRGRKLQAMTWKETFFDMKIEYSFRRPMRAAAAADKEKKWFARAACGMEFPPPPLPERPRPTFDPLVFPQGAWQVHPDSSPALTVECLQQLSLVASAKEMVTLQRVVRSWKLSEGQVRTAFMKYERFVRLQLKHPRTLLIPTADIELVWQSHLIRPAMYERDFKEVLGAKFLDHSLLSTGYDYHFQHAALVETAQLWEAEYNEVYCTLPTAPLVRPSPYLDEDLLSCRISTTTQARLYHIADPPAAADPANSWTSPFSLQVSHVMEDLQWVVYFARDQDMSEDQMWIPGEWFRRVAKSYERFLFFCHRASFLSDECHHGGSAPFFAHPTYAIDLFWHTHMVHPVAYRKDCDLLVGRLVDHSPWPENYEQANFDETNRIWKEEFGIEIQMENQLELERPPNHNLDRGYY